MDSAQNMFSKKAGAVFGISIMFAIAACFLLTPVASTKSGHAAEPYNSMRERVARPLVMVSDVDMPLWLYDAQKGRPPAPQTPPLRCRGCGGSYGMRGDAFNDMPAVDPMRPVMGRDDLDRAVSLIRAAPSGEVAMHNLEREIGPRPWRFEWRSERMGLARMDLNAVLDDTRESQALVMETQWFSPNQGVFCMRIARDGR